MTAEYLILIVGFVFGFYMAWNIGANDVANSMASAVGAKAITIRQAVVIAGILNIVGATFIGAHVTNTIRKGIVSTEVMSDPHVALAGALAALLAAALWVSFATWRSLPVSTTHSIVGAMIVFGIMAGGFSVINWGKLGAVVLSWVISPIFSLVIAVVMFKIIVRVILSRDAVYERSLRSSPFFIGIAVFVVILSFLFKTPLGHELSLSTPMALMTAFVSAAVLGYMGKCLLQKMIGQNQADDNGAEEVFRRIQIGTSCYVALAQGANDVANAIGPLAVIYFLVKTVATSRVRFSPCRDVMSGVKCLMADSADPLMNVLPRSLRCGIVPPVTTRGQLDRRRFNSPRTGALSTLITASAKNTSEIGRPRKPVHCWSKIIIDCASDVSTSPPSTSPMMIGAGLKP